MTKRAIVSPYEDSKEGRVYTRVIKVMKSLRIGAYIFDEQMVANEKVQDSSKKQSE